MAKLTPKLTVTSQLEAALHAGQQIREEHYARLRRSKIHLWGFVGKAQKKTLAHKLWLELTI